MPGVFHGLIIFGLLASPSLARAEGSSPSPAQAKPAQSPVRVFMRTDGQPLVFSAREEKSTGEARLCTAPCDAGFAPGDYRLKLNGVPVSDSVKLASPGTLHGVFLSHEGAREGGWLALNVGGILGGVFITVAALGGPSWAYVAGGGSLAAGGLIFLVSYRADRATVSFTPDEPADVHGMPSPAPRSDAQNLSSDRRPRIGVEGRGIGFRVAF